MNFEELDRLEASEPPFVSTRVMRIPRAYDANALSLKSALVTGSETLTQQQYKNDADINTIVKRFSMVPQAGPPVLGEGVYGDFTGITDYHSALERVQRAEADFMRLPPDIRERFNNDAAQFMDFAATAPEEVLRTELNLGENWVPSARAVPGVEPAAPVPPAAAAAEGSGV